MKKFLSLLFFVAMSMPMWGVTYVADNLLYEQVTSSSGSTPGTVKCVGFNKTPSTNTALNIPYMITVNGYSFYVNTIASNAFNGKTEITSVRLNYGIKEIEADAFKNCTSLTSVRLPSSMEYIYSNAFGGCTALTSVYFASSTGKLKGYSASAFPASTKCTLYVPRTLLNPDDMRAQSIWGTDKFKTITETGYAYDIYMADGTMAVVTKPSTSTSVDHECTIIGFNKNGGNTGVAEGIYRPSNYRTKPSNQDRYFKYVAVADFAFDHNTDLTQLDLSNLTAITSYGVYMARSATNLTSARLSKGALSGNAFTGCSKLSSLDLGSVTSIGSFEFSECTSLKQLNIPATVTSIAASCVDDCSALEDIKVASGNPNYESHSSALYTKGQKNLIKVPEGYEFSAYETSPLCEVIERDAFRKVPEIQNIRVTYGCKTIKQAFNMCSALKVVEIPSSVQSLHSNTFNGCTALTDLYVNLNTNYIPTITKTAFLQGCGNPNLYVQRGKESTFQSKGWTGFKSYNKDGIVPADYRNGALGYTVKQAGAVTVNGLKFTGGTCKLVRRTRNSLSGTVNVPGYVYIGNKDYVVDEIAEEAFSNTSSFSITGCDYVTTVGYKAFDSQPLTSIQLPRVTSIGLNAFDNCTSLRTVSWGADLKEIKAYAFRGCPITNDIILPVGFTSLGDDALSGVKSKTILVPSTATGIVPRSFYGMSSLTQLIINNSAANKLSMVLTGVPTSCIVRVPVDCRDAVKANTSFKSYTVNAGAYDFYRTNTSSVYKMTVTSTTLVTKDGVTYAGTAKYVYNKELNGASAFYAALSETDNVLNSGKRYLITEVGDSCFYGSTVSVATLNDAKYLSKIGRKAFSGSLVRDITVPDEVTRIGAEAFSNAKSLNDLTLLSSNVNYDTQWVGGNAADFTLYINNYSVASVLNSNLKNWAFNGTSNMVRAHVAPYFTPQGETYNLGQSMPLDFQASGVKAYIVTGFDATSKVLKTAEVKQVPGNTGVIITDLTPNKMYKIKRASSYSSTSNNLLVANADGMADLSKVSYSYYWHYGNKKFEKVYGSYNLPAGLSYLKLNSTGGNVGAYTLDFLTPTPDFKKGDVNGDGTVDITDANTLINIILGTDSARNYNGRADVNGDGVVDVSDTNEVINIILKD